MNEGLFYGGVIGVFLIVCVLVETFVIKAYKIARFMRALLQSLAVNSVSAGLVYLLWPLVRRMNFDEGKAFPLLPILVIGTMLSEALLLKLLNRQQPWKRVLVTAAVMNAVSFFILFLLLSLL